MSVKIRLARRGRRKNPYYHIVVADARAPRDGRFIENLGSYNPMTTPATIQLDIDKTYEWLQNGAQPTHTARAILRFKGVMYKKHLQRGVAKGALTQEAADQMLKDWISAKEAKVAERVAEARKEKEDFRKMISGEVKVVQKETADDDAKEAFRETQEVAAPEEEAVSEATETVVEEAAAVVEETVEAVAETTEEVVEAVEEKVEEVAEVVEKKVEEVAEAVTETTEEVVEEVKEIVSEEAPSTEEE